jgi:hypothetical protein
MIWRLDVSKLGQTISNRNFDVLGIEEAICELEFIENAVADADTKWHTFNIG